MVIWKFDASVAFNVPHGARLLTVDDQRGNLVAWFEVDPEMAAGESVDTWGVVATVTGGYVPSGFEEFYVRTLQSYNGAFVRHIYAKRLRSTLVLVDATVEEGGL